MRIYIQSVDIRSSNAFTLCLFCNVIVDLCVCVCLLLMSYWNGNFCVHFVPCITFYLIIKVGMHTKLCHMKAAFGTPFAYRFSTTVRVARHGTTGHFILFLVIFVASFAVF